MLVMMMVMVMVVINSESAGADADADADGYGDDNNGDSGNGDGDAGDYGSACVAQLPTLYTTVISHITEAANQNRNLTWLCALDMDYVVCLFVVCRLL